MNRFVLEREKMYLLVLMGISALVGVLTVISEKFKIGRTTLVEGPHARIVGMLLTAPIVYTFITVLLYGIMQLVTDLYVTPDTTNTMNLLQNVVTFGSILAAFAYALMHRGEVERLT
jgi:hypothetical protein